MITKGFQPLGPQDLLSRSRPNNCTNHSLLHGFPTSSHMFRNLIPALAEEYHVPIMPGFPSFVPTVPDHYHVVAPDLPGFGFSDAPDRKRFNYTFKNLAKSIDRFTKTIVSSATPFTCLNTGRNQRRRIVQLFGNS
jgi:hypothetical protein